MRSVLILCILALCCSLARADTSDAKAHYEKGNAAYALGDYASAAAEYERAFQLKPDPALLYNAAQAHRVAGNKQRALLLYQNYLRVYGSSARNVDEAQRHIDELLHAIESEHNAQTAPSTAPIPLQETQHAPTPPPTVAPEAMKATPAPATSSVALTATPPPREARPVWKKPWFWAVTGGAVLVVAGVAIGLGVGLNHDKNPSPSLGAVAGN